MPERDPHEAITTPIVDPGIDPTLAAHLLALARAEVPDLKVNLAKVGFSDLRTSDTFSVTALLVAPPLFVLAERRFGRTDEGLDIVQVFELSRLVSLASSAGRCFAVIDMAKVDSTFTGFQVEGPLVSLPMYTTAADMLFGRS
jgi:hypothetical protein